MRALSAAVAVLGAVCGLAGCGCGVARAQVLCEGAACFLPVKVIPPDGANGIPTNVVFQVFGSPEDPRPFELMERGVSGALDLEVTAFHTSALQAFRVKPVAPLEPNTRYTFASASFQQFGDGVLDFSTGDGPDEDPPAFEGIRSIVWERIDNPCGEIAHYVVGLGAASDAVAQKQLTVYVYAAIAAGKQDFGAPQAVVPFADVLRLGRDACGENMSVVQGSRRFIVLGVVDWAGNETRSEEWYADAVDAPVGCTCGPGSGAADAAGAIFALLALAARGRAGARTRPR